MNRLVASGTTGLTPAANALHKEHAVQLHYGEEELIGHRLPGLLGLLRLLPLQLVRHRSDFESNLPPIPVGAGIDGQDLFRAVASPLTSPAASSGTVRIRIQPAHQSPPRRGSPKGSLPGGSLPPHLVLYAYA